MLPMACAGVVLTSVLYTHHRYRSSPHGGCPDEAQLLQELASIQITGMVIVAAIATAAVRMKRREEGEGEGRTQTTTHHCYHPCYSNDIAITVPPQHGDGTSSRRSRSSCSHSMPQNAALRRQQLGGGGGEGAVRPIV